MKKIKEKKNLSKSYLKFIYWSKILVFSIFSAFFLAFYVSLFSQHFSPSYSAPSDSIEVYPIQWEDGNDCYFINEHPNYNYFIPAKYEYEWTALRTHTPDGLTIHCPSDPPPFTCGDPLIYGGQSYNTVEIGDRCWMAENLNIGEMLSSADDYPDPCNGIIQKWCYNNNPNNCNIYGGLYTWNQAMKGITNEVEGIKGVCPDGWHIPTDDEWHELELLAQNTGGGSGNCNLNWGDSGTNPRCSPGGSVLRSEGYFPTNNLGFSILLAGNNVGGLYANIESHAYFWTSSKVDYYEDERPIFRDFYGTNFESYESIFRSPANFPNAKGYSVRCIQDIFPSPAPITGCDAPDPSIRD